MMETSKQQPPKKNLKKIWLNLNQIIMQTCNLPNCYYHPPKIGAMTRFRWFIWMHMSGPKRLLIWQVATNITILILIEINLHCPPNV